MRGNCKRKPIQAKPRYSDASISQSTTSTRPRSIANPQNSSRASPIMSITVFIVSLFPSGESFGDGVVELAQRVGHSLMGALRGLPIPTEAGNFGELLGGRRWHAAGKVRAQAHTAHPG